MSSMRSGLRQENSYLSKEYDRLEGVERVFERVREVLGDQAVDEAIYATEQSRIQDWKQEKLNRKKYEQAL